MKQFFYVLYNKKEKGFYIDDPSGIRYITDDLNLAEQYKTLTIAETEKSYFKNSNEWEVKVVTISVEI